ncbi:hypothetical protein Ahy_B03g065031 [Arachis hypogaea]|uniref:FLZ-type domain-containing protein n=1 Tax=Arachis hypogaea TaxID=3818 RepID=A0A445A0M4_ARAHY|nr:hypothetical protein Ahy_B03g065031 [Arachis hypogaea]
MPSIPASGEESDEKQSFSSKNNFSSRNASSKCGWVIMWITTMWIGLRLDCVEKCCTCPYRLDLMLQCGFDLIPNHVAIKIALELKKLLIDNSLLDVYELFGNYFNGSIPEWIVQKKNLRSTVGYRQNVFSTTLSHLIATNSYHFLIPFIPIRGTLFLYHLSLHQNFQSQSNFFTERLKDKLEEFFNCQYKRFVEFTALISWRRGANIGWHSDDNRPYLKQRHFAVVCYLNNYGKDFNGGLFCFQDGQPMSIMPMAELKIQIPPLPPEGERVFKGCVSASELELMELFEDYTCMIFHCPNPRNTHIFDNCIIQSTPSVSPKLDASTWYPSHSFLTVCFICNKNLGHGKDIYMYRGERAFCNNECCYQGMLMEEEINKLEAEEADVRDCRIFRYKRVNLERQAVKLNRVKLEACLTYPLCNNCSTMPPPFLNAYTLPRLQLSARKGKIVEVGRAHFETKSTRFTILNAPEYLYCWKEKH